MFDNIIILTGPVNAVVRQGGADDWAAYHLRDGEDVNSGSLVKMFKSECDKTGITTVVESMYPNLTYRY